MSEFNNLKSEFMRSYQNKCKLLSQSSKFLTKCIVELKEKCFLVHVNNYFVTGEQRAAVYWRGTYACQNTGCATYVFSISSLDDLEYFLIAK